RVTFRAHALLRFFLSLLRRPPISPLFPYTTLFRSARGRLPDLAAPGARLGGYPPDQARHRDHAGESLVRLLLRDLPGRRRHPDRSEEHTSELQSPYDLVCRLLLEKKKQKTRHYTYT